MIYDEILSPANTAAVEGYLNAKWALGIPEPSSLVLLSLSFVGIFAGRWRITSMTEWDNDFIDAEVPGYFNFAKDGLGGFQFGYVRCDIDWRETDRDGAAAVDFSFEGMDEMEQCSGRGRATISGDTLDGMIYFHRGDESGFTAKKQKRS